MALFDRLVSWLRTPSYVQRPPEVQPNVLSVGGHYFYTGPEAIPPITTDLQMTAILTVPIVGFSEPNPVELYGDMPMGFVPGEAPGIAQNDATEGNC